jgi:hypothetical protein
VTVDPAGDTGVYIWNLWVFQHELLDHWRLPYFTDAILASGDIANLSLHNYTLFQNLLALPLIPFIGIIASFNTVTLLMQVITAHATFLLARRVTKVGDGDGGTRDSNAPEAWLAGLLFAWSPVLVARSTAHFSLVAAAPLAVFLACLLRLDENIQRGARMSVRLGAAFGATLWWAASTDVYYAVYCALIAATYLVFRFVATTSAPVADGRWRVGCDIAIASLALLALAIASTGGWQLTLAGHAISMRTTYTPLLALTSLVPIRFALRRRLALQSVSRSATTHLLGTGAVAAAVAAVLMAPVLYATAERIVAGDFETPPLLWRSSPPGIDVLSLVLPNPNHSWTPHMVSTWLDARPNGLVENVASIPLVALAVLVLAWRAGWVPPTIWTRLSIVFGLLALGPFVQIAGFSTRVPGPWALLRYVPVVGLARSPTRFAIVLTLVVAVLFALALTRLGQRYPHRRRMTLGIVGVLLAVELLPSPRPLHAASIPHIYRRVASAAAGSQLLELPFGIRDGASSVGNATAQSQFFQTAHGKPIQGGYLSRIERSRVAAARRQPVLDALLTLSEGRQITAEQERRLVEDGPSFIKRRSIAFVVIDRTRTPERLRDLAIIAFGLHIVEADDAFELYVSRHSLAPKR